MRTAAKADLAEVEASMRGLARLNVRQIAA